MTTESQFFKAKRPWSRVKDRVVGSYLVPYFRKTSKLRQHIVIVDAFAGPGIFDDGSKGSPLIICEIAEQLIPKQYYGIFVNKEEESYQVLNNKLQKYIDGKKAISILGNAQDLLSELTNIVGSATILIYLDPFGLKGCEFKLLEPYLGRDKRFSTEIIINMSMPTLHRLSTSRAIKENRRCSRTDKLNQRLTEILGGDFWKEIMWGDYSAEEKEKKVVQKYVELLKTYLPYAGFCPVRVQLGRRVKYYMIFASRHPDALILMNDIMYKAYFQTMYEIEYKGTLFEGTTDWREEPRNEELENIIIKNVEQHPGITREQVWLKILDKNFMKWPRSTFNKKIRELIPQKLYFISSTNRFNKDSRLYIKPRQKNSTNKAAHLKKLSIRTKVHYKTFPIISGGRKKLVERVNDGSIIVRFNKTPIPKKYDDVVCPHFLELKWAYGCPHDCSWCYLKGTFRFQPKGKAPVVKEYDKTELHTKIFLTDVKTPEILNTGEIADSLMFESGDNPFSKFIIPLFESQRRHRVLFLTKSDNIKNLLEIKSHNQVIMSFSLNAVPVADKWEKAPKVTRRIEAAQKLYEAGYEVRIRIDPMVPIENWKGHYLELLNLIFDKFKPARITLGSLRGLQSTINGCTDKSWVKYLKESSNWGKKIDFTTRFKMYQTLINYLKKQYKYNKVALCKETLVMWRKLGMNYRRIRCNCI